MGLKKTPTEGGSGGKPGQFEYAALGPYRRDQVDGRASSLDVGRVSAGEGTLRPFRRTVSIAMPCAG
jgi:hypothetical protein